MMLFSTLWHTTYHHGFVRSNRSVNDAIHYYSLTCPPSWSGQTGQWMMLFTTLWHAHHPGFVRSMMLFTTLWHALHPGFVRSMMLFTTLWHAHHHGFVRSMMLFSTLTCPTPWLCQVKQVNDAIHYSLTCPPPWLCQVKQINDGIHYSLACTSPWLCWVKQVCDAIHYSLTVTHQSSWLCQVKHVNEVFHYLVSDQQITLDLWYLMSIIYQISVAIHYSQIRPQCWFCQVNDMCLFITRSPASLSCCHHPMLFHCSQIYMRITVALVYYYTISLWYNYKATLQVLIHVNESKPHSKLANHPAKMCHLHLHHF